MFEQCMYFNTAALTRRLEIEWAKAFKPFDLAPPQAFMLRTILKSPGVSVSKLAVDLSISKPTVTRSLDGLVAKGLITRESIEHDARQIAIYPTENAKKIERSLNDASAIVTMNIKSILGDEMFAKFVNDVRLIKNALD